MSKAVLWSVAVLALFETAGANTGSSDCPCWLEYQRTTFVVKQGSRSFPLPTTYGRLCNAHDEGQSPWCSGSNPPAFCPQPWCFVDAANCRDTRFGRSQFYEVGDEIYYSYDTCGSSDTWSTWQAGDSDMASLHLITDQNLILIRDDLEIESSVLADELGTCQAPAELCQQSARVGSPHYKFGAVTNFDRAGTYFNPLEPDTKEAAKCMFKAAEPPMLRLGNKEQDADGSKYAMIYAGNQAGGNYIQWPDSEQCMDEDYQRTKNSADPKSVEPPFDARLRPWYSTGLTSPKDLMIVVDTSGSMAKQGRDVLARKAVDAILKTVTFKDFINIIHFSNQIVRTYDDTAVPGSSENVAKMRAWAKDESMSWASGGTNFREAFKETFSLFRTSRSKSASSWCQKVVLFLTDGRDDAFQESDFADVQRQAQENGMIIMTYALGDIDTEDPTKGVDITTAQKLACQNNGIFYHIPDNAGVDSEGGGLMNTMAKYYEYFTAGQKICSSSATRYDDFTNGEEFYASCLPMYDRNTNNDGLYHPLGVVCQDYNLIKDINSLKQDAGWDSFVCLVSDITKKCKALDYDECHLQKLRRRVGESSVCTAAHNSGQDDCPCTNPDCQDSEDYVDGFGFFCDVWVGDDCDEIKTIFPEYTDATIAAIKQQCKRSCGLCPKTIQNCALDRSCPDEGVIETRACRACATPKTTTGVGIDGKSMCCPGEVCAEQGGAGAGAGAGQGGAGPDSKSDSASEQGVLAGALLSLAVALAAEAATRI